MKKSFKDTNNPANSFITTPEEATQGEQHTQHTHDTQKKTRVQKHPRINMAFPEANFEYLQLISRLDNVSMTEYVNNLILTDSKTRAEFVAEARKLIKGETE